MQEFVSNNKYSLLNIKQKYSWLVILSFILLIIIVTATICIKTYDTINYNGVAIDNQIMISVKSSDVHNLVNSDYLKIDDQKLEFSILSVGELQYDELLNINYQIVILSTSNNYLDNLSLNLTFYKNKQRIITKIINLLK